MAGVFILVAVLWAKIVIPIRLQSSSATTINLISTTEWIGNLILEWWTVRGTRSIRSTLQKRIRLTKGVNWIKHWKGRKIDNLRYLRHNPSSLRKSKGSSLNECFIVESNKNRVVFNTFSLPLVVNRKNPFCGYFLPADWTINSVHAILWWEILPRDKDIAWNMEECHRNKLQ